MPIFEFECKQCGEISEVFVMGSPADGILACKHCGSRDLEKILSVSSFTFADSSRAPGATCCGREERCDSPPCSTGRFCRRDE